MNIVRTVWFVQWWMKWFVHEHMVINVFIYFIWKFSNHFPKQMMPIDSKPLYRLFHLFIIINNWENFAQICQLLFLFLRKFRLQTIILLHVFGYFIKLNVMITWSLSIIEKNLQICQLPFLLYFSLSILVTIILLVVFRYF